MPNPPAKINLVIPQAGFELIRDRLAVILDVELDNQYIKSYDKDFDIEKIWVERNTPIDKSESVFINVSLLKGDFDNKSQVAEDGNYSFAIDCVTNSKTIGDEDGDLLSAVIAHKITRAIRYIFNDPQYNTLGFDRPFISRVMVPKIEAGNLAMDAVNSSIMRTIVNVKCTEKNGLLPGSTLSGYQTQIKLQQSEKGYFYTNP